MPKPGFAWAMASVDTISAAKSKDCLFIRMVNVGFVVHPYERI
jgi:hypothetical protein